MTTERATSWSVTINNPTQEDEEQIALARQRGWKIEGQLEKGASGTPHYQLHVRTPQVRFSALKKAFPRSHIEIARNSAALAAYVTKADTRVGSLQSSQETYPSLSKFWVLVYNELSDEWNGPAEDYILDNKMNDKHLLMMFDEVVYRLIYNGYHVESYATNPQIRSQFTKFAGAILMRAARDIQTARHATAFEQTVDVPTVVT